MKKLLFAALVTINFSINGQNQSKFIYISNPALRSDAEKLHLTEDQLLFQMNQNAVKRMEQTQSTPLSRTTATVYPACTNMDFETGATSGWSITMGSTFLTNNTCLLGNCCPSVSTTYTVFSNGYIDPLMPTMPLNSQYGSSGTGTKFIKLNDEFAAGNEQNISQSFSVTTSNNLFKYSYMYVSSSGGHPCCDEPFLRVRFLDSQNQNINNMIVPTFTISPGCNPTYSQTTAGMTVCPTNTNYVYTPWIQGVADLSPFIGSFVTFELTVGDCASMGHASYCYFDSKCSALTFSMNGNPSQLDSTNNICASSLPMTLTAPAGFVSYSWTGPNSSSTSSLNVTSYGSYTLAMTAMAQCCPSYKVFNISPCTGITERTTKSNDVFMYPNPAHDHITFENAAGAFHYEIYDLFGKLIKGKEALPENKTVSISDLDAGIYFIKLTDSSAKGKTFKVIKE